MVNTPLLLHIEPLGKFVLLVGISLIDKLFTNVASSLSASIFEPIMWVFLYSFVVLFWPPITDECSAFALFFCPPPIKVKLASAIFPWPPETTEDFAEVVFAHPPAITE